MLIHCPKVAMIWQLIFALFVFNGLCPILSRKPFLGGTAPLLERKEKRHVMQPLYGKREIEESLKILN